MASDNIRQREFIALSLFAIMALSGCVHSRQANGIQIIGKITSSDLKFVTNSVQQNLRSQILPDLNWINDNSYHTKFEYTDRDLKKYEAVHILWIEVNSDYVIHVFAGVNKELIRSEGYSYTFMKVPNLTNTGRSYWGEPKYAPHDMRVPQ